MAEKLADHTHPETKLLGLQRVGSPSSTQSRNTCSVDVLGRDVVV